MSTLLPVAGQVLRLRNYASNLPTLRSDDGFRDASGSLVDPATVTVKVKDGSGATTIYTLAGGQVIRDALGLYHIDLDTTALAGPWSWAWSSTAPQTYQSDSVTVTAAPV